uniref:Uncharacterized protein n=2 Tax=Triticum urartu TaxID=4572 RepID=A0A8R7QMG4_TRIUA
MSRGMKRKTSAASAFPMQRSEVTKRFQTSCRDGRRQHLGPGDSLHLMDKGRSWRLVKHPSVGLC